MAHGTRPRYILRVFPECFSKESLGLGILIVLSFVCDRKVMGPITAMGMESMGVLVPHAVLERLIRHAGVGRTRLGKTWKKRQTERRHADV